MPGPASWLALLAATTLGSASLTEVQVTAGGVRAQSPMRLVVQTYAPENVDALGRVSPRARPLGSMQRAVSAEELARGVPVSVLQLDERDAQVVVAGSNRANPTWSSTAKNCQAGSRSPGAGSPFPRGRARSHRDALRLIRDLRRLRFRRCGAVATP
ncbi:MAG: hypothetical protein U0263_21220 [Polyangiaceae bacterium]